MALYALSGIAGLPVFSNAGHGIEVVTGATGGFIIGFIAAAAVVGFLAERDWSSHAVKMFVSYAIGSLVIYAVGVPVLSSVAFEGNLGAAASVMAPYLIWDAVKALAAAALLPLAWKGVAKLKG
jgi:biotin transport system substrate-specific component